MMPAHRPSVSAPPQPTKIFFDPFNSSSTGHQRAANRLSGSTSWRDSRSHKLSHQFRDTSGRGGEQHLLDLVGAGSENFGQDGRKENGDWEPGAPGLREKGWQDIRGLMDGVRKRSSDGLLDDDVTSERKRQKSPPAEDDYAAHSYGEPSAQTQTATKTPAREEAVPTIDDLTSGEPAQPPQIFCGLNIYLNGSTAPLVSDHKLKQLFARHGGGASIALGRRTVTHVIIGEKCGGGLASGKIQKEVTTVGGKGIKFVTAQWILDSVEKGVRLPESRYTPKTLNNRIGGSGQGSVRSMFTKK